MSELKAGFIDAYRTDIESMLTLAEELPLVCSPDVIVKGNPYTGDFEATVDGQVVEGQNYVAAESSRAQTQKRIGAVQMAGLGAQATMHLLAYEFKAAIPPFTAEPTPEQNELADSLQRKAQEQLYDGNFSYAAFEFVDNRSGESITISTCHMTNASSPVHARQLSLAISDAYVKKELTISDLPISFDGQTTFEIRQSISPVPDETLWQAATLFQENDSLDDMAIIHNLFAAELTGSRNADDEVEKLLAKYAHSGKLDQLKIILEAIKQKAEAAKMNSTFTMANPEMTLPSAEELADYKSILSQVRS